MGTFQGELRKPQRGELSSKPQAVQIMLRPRPSANPADKTQVACVAASRTTWDGVGRSLARNLAAATVPALAATRRVPLRVGPRVDLRWRNRHAARRFRGIMRDRALWQRRSNRTIP